MRVVAVTLYRGKRDRWRLPKTERWCLQCGGVFVVPAGSATQGRLFCCHRCANVHASARRPPSVRSAQSSKAGRVHAVKTRAKAAAVLIRAQLALIDRELRPDKDDRAVIKRSLMQVHQAAYRLGFAVGSRRARRFVVPKRAYRRAA